MGPALSLGAPLAAFGGAFPATAATSVMPASTTPALFGEAPELVTDVLVCALHRLQECSTDVGASVRTLAHFWSFDLLLVWSVLIKASLGLTGLLHVLASPAEADFNGLHASALTFSEDSMVSDHAASED